MRQTLWYVCSIAVSLLLAALASKAMAQTSLENLL
jgi:hypothetical protein